MQMKLVLEGQETIYFLDWSQSPQYQYQNSLPIYIRISADLQGYCNTFFILSQNCGCAKFHTEYVPNIEYNLSHTHKII